MTNLKMYDNPNIQILVVGDFMIDRYLYSSVSRISPEAPVPIAKVKRVERRIGGAGNVALNIIALGSKVRLLTAVGMDAAGEELIRCMENEGADISYIYRDEARKTSIKTRVVAQNQQLLRYDEEEITAAGKNFTDFVESKSDQIFENIQGIVLSDYGKGILTPEITQLIITEAKRRNLPVLVDPKGADYSKYSGATICTPNLKELTEASGLQQLNSENEIRDASLDICNKFDIAYMLTTRSEKGMSLISKEFGTKQDFPAIAQEVCDVTGAGDTVISTMSICVTAGYPLDICCKLSNVAASVVVSKFGAATATVQEINRVLSANTCENADHQKIWNADQIVDIALRLKNDGKKIIFTNGCFDIIHAGHIASFRQARSFGDVLIVGVNSDASIKRLKGDKRPVVSLENRMKLLEALEMIDYIVAFDQDTPQLLIESIKPDILVKGKDWEGKEVAGAKFIEEYGGTVKFVDLEKGLSTTAIIERILELNK